MLAELMPGGPVIDVTAVLLAVTGGRRVELNQPEKMIAMAMILAAGGWQADVAARLGISKGEVSRMHARLRAAIPVDRPVPHKPYGKPAA